MFQIVIGVIAVFLAAMLVIAGMNYLNIDRMTEIGLATRIEAESAAIRSAIAAYRVANGYLPEGEQWPSGLAPYLATPSILDMPSPKGDGGEEDEEEPDPALPVKGSEWAFHWSSGRTEGKPYICVSRTGAGPIEIEAARRIAFPAAAPGWKAVMAVACGASPGEAGPPPGTGDDLALTFYLYDAPAADEAD